MKTPAPPHANYPPSNHGSGHGASPKGRRRLPKHYCQLPRLPEGGYILFQTESQNIRLGGPSLASYQGTSRVLLQHLLVEATTFFAGELIHFLILPETEKLAAQLSRSGGAHGSQGLTSDLLEGDKA